MARIRTVKPEFWTDGRMVKLGPFIRLFYIGTWNFALCDQGHLPDDPMSLKLKILPADPVDADELVDALVADGRLIRKTTEDGRKYLHILRLSEHQKVDARWQSRCPYCFAEATAQSNGTSEPPPEDPEHEDPRPDSQSLAETPVSLSEAPASHAESHGDSPMGSKGKERKGKEVLKNSSSSAPRPRDCDLPPDDPQPDDDADLGAIPGLRSVPPSVKKPEPGSDDDPDWRKFWAVFPQKRGKKEARGAWAKAIKARHDPRDIIAGAERFAADVAQKGTPKDKVKWGQGWLNGERWTDEYDTTQPTNVHHLPNRNDPRFAPGSGQSNLPASSEYGQGKARI